MSDLQAFKLNFDIVAVASDLGCLPPKRGAIYQGGDCPTGHDSKEKRCYTIFPHTQSGRCFHCGISFDVIELPRIVKKFEFREACNWLSDTYHVPRLATKGMNEKERAEYEAKIRQQQLIFHLLTESAFFYHEKLNSDEEMKDYLINHYGLNEETISSHSIGYSTGEGLLKHLIDKGYHKEDITGTGLFVKVGGQILEFFNNRLIFPYWNTGKVVYFIGRKTNRTPDKEWEQAKYKKLPVHSEKYPYISEFISNQYYYGEDSTKRQESIFVAEGVTDCLALLQLGKACISPVTVRFREADFPRLEKLTKQVQTIYLIPDNEENRAGIDGALDTATRLEKLGKSVFIITIPRSDGQDKVDLNEYLLTHSENDFDELVKQGKPPWQIKVNQLNISDDQIKAIQSVKYFILTQLLHYDYLTVKTIIKNHLKKKFSLDADDVKELLRLWGEEKSDAQKLLPEFDNNLTSDKFSIPLFEKNGCIYKRKVKEKFGVKILEEIRITSFSIRPVESIIIPGEGETLRVKVKTDHKKFDVNFLPNCWSSPKRFMDSLPAKESIFIGSSVDVQYIRGYLANFEMSHKTGVRTSGLHDGKFITEEGGLSSQGLSKDIIYFNEIETNCKLISTTPAIDSELTEIKKYIASFNIPTVSLPVLGWTIACFFKPRLMSVLEEIGLSNGFPLLNVQGEAGAGKTSTTRDILMRIWNIKNESKSIGELTKFTMMKLVDGSNVIPVFMEENKSCIQTEYHQNLISNLIRSTYNCLEGERGRADQSTQVYRYQAPVVIVGETGFTEPALLDRFIMVFMSKKESYPYLQNFKELRKLPLEKLGRAVLEKSLRMDKGNIKDILEAEHKTIDSELTDRPRTNATVCRFGLRILGDILGVCFDLSRIDEAVKEGIKEGDSIYRKSAVDKILEAMCLMSEFQSKTVAGREEKHYKYQDHLEDGIDYKVIFEPGITSLRLYIHGAYPTFLKWARAYSFEGDLLPQITFKKQLQKESYYLSHKNMRLGQDQRKTFELNVDKMKEKGLEITKYWQFDTGEAPF